MGHPGVFRGSRFTFLVSEKPAYKAGVDGGYTADALSKIQSRYFKRYPVELAMDQEPTPEFLSSVDDEAPDEEQIEPDQDKLSPEEYIAEVERLKERTLLITIRKAQLKRWCSYQYLKDHDIDPTESGAQNPYRILLWKLTGVGFVRPRHRPAYQFYRKLPHVQTQIDKIAKVRGATKANGANLRREIAQELFEALDEDSQTEWSGLADQEHDEAMEKWKHDTTSPPSTAPTDRQRCIEALVRFILPILNLICEATGWKATLLAGGPEPAMGGRLNMISIHSGETKGDIPMNFGSVERANYKKHIVPIYGAFLKKCYNVEDCRSRALQETDGFLPLESAQLEAGGVNCDAIKLGNEDQSSPTPTSTPTLSASADLGLASIAPTIPSLTPTTVPSTSKANAKARPKAKSKSKSKTTSTANATRPPAVSLKVTLTPQVPLTPKETLLPPPASTSPPTRAVLVPIIGLTQASVPLKPSASAAAMMVDVIKHFALPPISPTRNPGATSLSPSPPPSPLLHPMFDLLPSPILRRMSLPPGSPSPVNTNTSTQSTADGGNTLIPGSPSPVETEIDAHKTDKVDKASEVPSKRGRASADNNTSIGMVAKVRGVAEPEGRAVAKKRKTGSGRGIDVDSTPIAEPTNTSHASSARHSHRSRVPTKPSREPRTIAAIQSMAAFQDTTATAISSVAAPSPVLAPATPKKPAWFIAALSMMENPDLGQTWSKLVEVWSLFETQADYEEVKKLSTINRPEAIKTWIQRSRPSVWRPVIDDVQVYEAMYITWWTGLQPNWRKSTNGKLVFSRVIGGDWEQLRRPGLNGLVSVMAALLFWGVVLQDSGGERKGWDKAVSDCLVVLNQLVT